MMESHTGSPPWVVDPSSPDCGNEAQPSTAEKFLDRLNIEDQSPMPVQQRLPDIAHVQDLLRLKSNDEDFERDHDILKVLHNHQTQDKETKYPLDQKQKQEREKQSSVKQEVEEQELDQGKLQYPQDQNKQPVTEQVSSIGPSSPDPTNPDQEPVTDKPCGDETGEPGGGIPAVVITQAQEARELAQVKPGEPEAARLKGPERPQDLIIPAVSVMATGPNPIPISSQGLSPHLSTMTSFSPFPSQGRSPSPCPSLSPGPSPSPCPSLSPGSSPSPSPSLSPGFSDCPSPSPITSPCLSDASDGVDMACSDLLSLRSDSVSLCASEVTISSRGYREQQGQEDDTRSVAASSVMSLFHRIQMEPLEKDWLRSCVLGNTAALRQLLRQDPSLASKKDFITVSTHSLKCKSSPSPIKLSDMQYNCVNIL
ncbi:mediator of RNA polymerase II transcription subunit 15-like isoform X3 [Osmerus eperlanus]|uniref:mediator of RNA polymerase II transcription subunit 15-like isoform X3 n=1 Tax=Osmerus eperlanus TaxID=29151 RepID=UPI002E122A2D